MSKLITVQVKHIGRVFLGNGEPSFQSYEGLPSDDSILGKRIEAVGGCEVEGAYGPEKVTVLLFDDGTACGFVRPPEN